MMELDIEVKLNLYKFIAEAGLAPTSAQVSAALDVAIPEVEAAFKRLAEERLLVLEPNDPSRIRMAPPFAGIETPHLVRVDGNSYYANCAWDALGIPAAFGKDADITSTCPDCGQKLAFQVRNGRPFTQDCVIHFAVPAAHWWDDIIYTCQTILFFRSEEHLDQWCQAHSVPRRPIISLDQCWQLAAIWYSNRLTVESSRPAPDEIVAIFAGIGLEGPFWDPKSDQWS